MSELGSLGADGARQPLQGKRLRTASDEGCMERALGAIIMKPPAELASKLGRDEEGKAMTQAWPGSRLRSGFFGLKGTRGGWLESAGKEVESHLSQGGARERAL